MVSSRSVGVEEEFLLVEPETGRPMAVAGTVLQAAGQAAGSDLEAELQQQQLETNSRPCQSLDDLHRDLRRCRASAATAASRAGARVAALGTSPVPVDPRPVRTSRYQRMAEDFGLTAHEQLTCGCHVHVEISSAEEGVAVLDRAGPWLATLLALSANSPFWQGLDSSYASFRYQVWGRWPCSGPTEPFETVQAYHQTVRQMVATGTLTDSGMVYFNARLSERYPTIEIRIADVCLRAEDTVLIAALARALVETEARASREARPARAGAGRAAAAGRLARQPVRPGRRAAEPGDRPAGAGGDRRTTAARPLPGRPRRCRGYRCRGRTHGGGARAGQRRLLPAGRIPPLRPPVRCDPRCDRSHRSSLIPGGTARRAKPRHGLGVRGYSLAQPHRAGSGQCLAAAGEVVLGLDDQGGEVICDACRSTLNRRSSAK